MVDVPTSQPPKKRYPAIYERSIPLIIGILVITIVIMLLFTIAVALGLFN